MEESRKTTGGWLGRTGLYIGLLTAITGLAVNAAEWLARHVGAGTTVPLLGNIDWVTKTLSYGLVIGLAKDVVMVLVELPKRAQSIKATEWLGDGAKIFFAVGACLFAFDTFNPEKPVEALSLLPAYPVVMTPEEPQVLAVLPVFYVKNAARGKGGSWGQGVILSETESPGANRHIHELVSRLVERCHPTDSTQRIRLDVIGYASSAEFTGQAKDASDMLNMDVSNARAAEGVKVLTDAAKGNPAVVVTHRQFKEPSTMFAQRTYLDRLGGKLASDHELLNRRMEIRILEAGSCTDRVRLVGLLR